MKLTLQRARFKSRSVSRLPPLPPFPVSRPSFDQPPEPQRFRVCEVCAQQFDTEDQHQVFHHGPEPHEPLSEDR